MTIAFITNTDFLIEFLFSNNIKEMNQSNRRAFIIPPLKLTLKQQYY